MPTEQEAVQLVVDAGLGDLLAESCRIVGRETDGEGVVHPVWECPTDDAADDLARLIQAGPIVVRPAPQSDTKSVDEKRPEVVAAAKKE